MADRTQKYATEMTMQEFESWATGYIIFGIGDGTSLKSLVETIVNQAAGNTEWGGSKPLPRGDDLSAINGMGPRSGVLYFLWASRKIQTWIAVADVIHWTCDRVETKADPPRSIKAAIRSLEKSGLVTVSNNMVGLSQKGIRLVKGR